MPQDRARSRGCETSVQEIRAQKSYADEMDAPTREHRTRRPWKKAHGAEIEKLRARAESEKIEPGAFHPWKS